MSALNKISMAIAGLFGTDANATPLSNRNYIVDGNFDQWTTTSQANPGAAYGPSPMYINYVGTSGAGTVSQGVFGGGEPLGLTSPARFAMVHAQTTAGTTAPFIQQKIESAYTLQGRSATFSCWLWVASGTLTITQLIAIQNFGTGGSPSAAVNVAPTVNWVLTTTPKKFSVRLDFPSVLGKTFGTNGNDCLQIGVYFPIGASNFTVTTTQWQLEKSSPRSSGDINGAGGLPTAFEYRGYGPELQRVQRYYESISISTGVPMICNGTTNLTNGVVTLQAKRLSPAIGVSNSGGATAQPGGQSVTSVTGSAIGLTNAIISATCSGGGLTIGWCYVITSTTTITADARL